MNIFLLNNYISYCSLFTQETKLYHKGKKVQKKIITFSAFCFSFLFNWAHYARNRERSGWFSPPPRHFCRIQNISVFMFLLLQGITSLCYNVFKTSWSCWGVRQWTNSDSYHLSNKPLQLHPQTTAAPFSPPVPLPFTHSVQLVPNPVLADQPASTAVMFGKQPAAKHGLPLTMSTDWDLSSVYIHFHEIYRHIFSCYSCLLNLLQYSH